MDTVRALTYMQIGQLNAKLLVKSDWFFWPMSVLLNTLGAIPINRNTAQGFVGEIAKEFRNRDEFILALVPEGTRKKPPAFAPGSGILHRPPMSPLSAGFLTTHVNKPVGLEKLCQETAWKQIF